MVKNLPAKAGDTRDVGSVSGFGRCPVGGNGNTLQYSCLENSMDRGAWWTTVHRISQSRIFKQFSMPIDIYIFIDIYFLFEGEGSLIA